MRVSQYDAKQLIDTSEHTALSAKFFKEFKRAARIKYLTQGQVDTLTYLVNIALRYYHYSPRELAYLFATIKGETGNKFVPVRETFARSDAQMAQNLNRLYPRKARTKRAYWDERIWGGNYGGRGLVQITWLSNYRKFSRILGMDLVHRPELALDPLLSSIIIIHGMRYGTFTGRKLSDYRNFYHMRKIINGTDKANLFARYAKQFYNMFKVVDIYKDILTNRIAPYNLNGVNTVNPDEFDTNEDFGNGPYKFPKPEPMPAPPYRYPENPVPNPNPNIFKKVKPFWKSKTILGGIAVLTYSLLGPILKGSAGIDIADPALYGATKPFLDLISTFVPAVAAITVIWGRIVADHSVTVKKLK